jgi:two-component system cell cycle sensor histidine kinase/response regulator CckA
VRPACSKSGRRGTLDAPGGTVEVVSKVGSGTTFRVSLPCAAETVAPAQAESHRPETGEGELLLVEDDAIVAATTQKALEGFGYRVIHASSGDRALELAREGSVRFRVVLLDLRMPGLSGEETFDALRALDPTLPVLVCSGYAAEQDVNGMLQRGAAGFVQKPYRIDELGRAVARAARAT